MNILAFDIETIPDTETGKRLHEMDGMPDEDIARAMQTLQSQKTGGSDFLPLHLHRIVAISVVRKSGDKFMVSSLGDKDSSEKELIKSFYSIIDRYTPTLVSWNGVGFDLPVLNYRSLLNQVTAQRYWEDGSEDNAFRFNNYFNRYHSRHTDLMDVLSGFSLRAAARLDDVAVMLGFPGKQGVSGAGVWDSYLAGKIGEIRDYCETDALNTYLVYLKWELVRGTLSEEQLEKEFADIKTWLKESKQKHFLEFLKAWQ